VLGQAREVAATGIAEGASGSAEVHRNALKCRCDLLALDPHSLDTERLVDSGDLARGSERLPGAVEPVVVHLDRDARHGINNTSKTNDLAHHILLIPSTNQAPALPPPGTPAEHRDLRGRAADRLGVGTEVIEVLADPQQ